MHKAFLPIQYPIGIYPVVDSLALVRRLAPYVTTMQLRIKTGSKLQIRADIKQAVAIADRHKLQLFINDYWQWALQYGAYGVHLGQEDVAAADTTALQRASVRLGISTHTRAEINYAYQYAPSYIAFGPVFFTTSKDMVYRPLGVRLLADWCQEARDRGMPSVAIGGINQDNIAEVANQQPSGIAMIGAITKHNQPERNVDRLAAVCGIGGTFYV